MIKNGLVKIGWALLVLFAAPVMALAAESGEGDIIVNSALQPSIQTQLNQFVTDVSNTGYTVVVKPMDGGSVTPLSIRSYLQGRVSHGMVGAILIGDFPMAQYAYTGTIGIWTENYVGPTDRFYMDLNGTWIDSNNDGYYDTFSGVTPEIWLGWIRGYPGTYYWDTSRGDQATLVNRYLDKNHKYRTGLLELKDRALYRSIWDASAYYNAYTDPNAGPVNGYEPRNDLKTLYGTNNVVEQYNAFSTPVTAYLAEISQNYEFVYEMSHGVADGHWPGGDNVLVTANTILSQNPSANFYVIDSCSTGQRMAASYICTTSCGLAAFCSTTIWWSAIGAPYIRSLAAGNNLGKAFKNECSDKDEGSANMGGLGMRLYADPTLTINLNFKPAPLPPQITSGLILVNLCKSFTYTASTTDPNGSQLQYTFDWGDGTTTVTTADYPSGSEAAASHTWYDSGIYNVRIKAINSWGRSSDWSIQQVTVKFMGVAIVITPTNATIENGQLFTAIGVYDDATTAVIRMPTWSSSNPSVATINASGLASGISGGIVTITATKDDVSGTTTLTVTPARLLISPDLTRSHYYQGNTSAILVVNISTNGLGTTGLTSNEFTTILDDITPISITFIETAIAGVYNGILDISTLPIGYHHLMVTVNGIGSAHAVLPIAGKGDFNMDGTVDMRDIGPLAKLISLTPTNPGWCGNADLNNDGKIDMIDVGTASRYYLTTYTYPVY